MGLVATSFYTVSKHISIFRRFHLNYTAQKEKRPLLSQDRFLAKIAIVFSARRIPAVFLINSAPRSMRRQNASLLKLDRNRELARAVDVMMARAKRIYILIVKVNKLFSFSSSRCFLKEIENMFSVFLSSYRNTRESLGELEKAVETLACGSCSHSISRSPKLSRVFP